MNVDRRKEIAIELTNRCNLQCKICSLWRNSSDLDLKAIIAFLDNYENIGVSLTGGEPFLYPDMDVLLKYLLKRAVKGEIRDIHISSNGTLGKVREFAGKYRKYAKWLGLTFSIDGIGKLHDIQRGVDGSFSATMENVTFLRKHIPELKISIKMVITQVNQNHIFPVWKLAKLLGIPVYFKIVENLASYYQRNSLADISIYPDFEFVYKSLQLVLEDARKIYNRQDHLFFFFCLENVLKFVENRNMSFISKCNTPGQYLFISVKGDIFPCLYMEHAGNIYNGLDNDKLKDRQDRALTGQCPRCMSYHGYLQECNYAMYNNEGIVL